jgi:hypothetical protein
MTIKKLVKKLSEHLSSFVEHNTEIDFAIEILALYTETEPNLGPLLTQYHQGLAVFYSLTRATQSPTTTALLAHLIEVNPNILHIPLSEGGLINHTLLLLFLNNKETYRGILEWLERNKPEVLAVEKIKREEIEQLYKSALAVLTKDSVIFQQYLSTLSIEIIHQLLATDEQNLLIQLLKRPIKHLNFLVMLDYSILHIYYDGTVLLNYLCDDPMIYSSTLIIIKEIYASTLSKKELAALDDAFEVEEERVKRHQRKSKNFMPQLMRVQELNPSIIEFSTLNALALPNSPFTLDDEKIKRFINTQLVLDSVVLDAYITQTFADNLIMKGIIVMPTIRTTEDISIAQQARIKACEPITYTSDIGIENGSIVVRGMIEKTPEKNARFIIWPINDEQKTHYGLFILDLTDNKSYYIEPFRLENILLSHQIKIKPLTAIPIDFTRLTKDKDYRQLTVANVSPFLYNHYLQKSTKNLSIKQEDIRYIHLAQTDDVNYSSDYIIAILAKLAAGEIDLINNPESLFSLEANQLNNAAVRVIRLLEIQRFKMDYFMFQLAEKFKAPIIELKQTIFPKDISPDYDSLLTNSFFSSSYPLKIVPQKMTPKKEYVRSPLGMTVKTAYDLEEEQSRQEQQARGGSCSPDDIYDDDIFKVRFVP